MFKTIMMQDSFEQEMRTKEKEQREIEAARQKVPQNPRVRLMQACVEVNDWITLDLILCGIYEGQFDLTMASNVLYAMHNAFHWLLEPQFRPINNSYALLPARFQSVKRRSFELAGSHSDHGLRQVESHEELLKQLHTIF